MKTSTKPWWGRLHKVREGAFAAHIYAGRAVVRLVDPENHFADAVFNSDDLANLANHLLDLAQELRVIEEKEGRR